MQRTASLLQGPFLKFIYYSDNNVGLLFGPPILYGGISIHFHDSELPVPGIVVCGLRNLGKKVHLQSVPGWPQGPRKGILHGHF